MSLLSKNSFFEEVDLNDSLEYLRKSLSSQKEELPDNAKSTIDLSSEDKNSNSTLRKKKINLLYKMNIDEVFNNKKKSKISLKIEEYNKQENIEQVFDDDDYFSDLDENYNSDSSQNINHNRIEMKKFNIFFFFEFNKRKQFLIPICTESFNINNINIIDLIKYVIYKINNSNIIVKYNDEDYSISLKDLEDDDDEKEKLDFYIDNYEIKPYEFRTKNNSQNYSTSTLLSAIKEENITLTPKNSLNVTPTKKFQSIKFFHEFLTTFCILFISNFKHRNCIY